LNRRESCQVIHPKNARRRNGSLSLKANSFTWSIIGGVMSKHTDRQVIKDLDRIMVHLNDIIYPEKGECIKNNLKNACYSIYRAIEFYEARVLRYKEPMLRVVK